MREEAALAVRVQDEQLLVGPVLRDEALVDLVVQVVPRAERRHDDRHPSRHEARRRRQPRLAPEALAAGAGQRRSTAPGDALAAVELALAVLRRREARLHGLVRLALRRLALRQRRRRAAVLAEAHDPQIRPAGDAAERRPRVLGDAVVELVARRVERVRRRAQRLGLHPAHGAPGLQRDLDPEPQLARGVEAPRAGHDGDERARRDASDPRVRLAPREHGDARRQARLVPGLAVRLPDRDAARALLAGRPRDGRDRERRRAQVRRLRRALLPRRREGPERRHPPPQKSRAARAAPAAARPRRAAGSPPRT
mmetsp:Transcript_30468/g.100844  ORF Transcript_30468/g.100844 Transcript_30468/m.100844 type:complete len:311 (+) Transcript_30468:649-1581(+)